MSLRGLSWTRLTLLSLFGGVCTLVVAAVLGGGESSDPGPSAATVAGVVAVLAITGAAAYRRALRDGVARPAAVVAGVAVMAMTFAMATAIVAVAASL
jgi:hypothetical protein